MHLRLQQGLLEDISGQGSNDGSAKRRSKVGAQILARGSLQHIMRILDDLRSFVFVELMDLEIFCHVRLLSVICFNLFSTHLCSCTATSMSPSAPQQQYF